LNSHKEAIHIPDMIENSGYVILFSELKQKDVWTKNSKGEGIGKRLSFCQGCIDRLVVLYFLRNNITYQREQVSFDKFIGKSF
jgi:hypothetical protein